jgi:hypothetical protein
MASGCYRDVTTWSVYENMLLSVGSQLWKLLQMWSTREPFAIVNPVAKLAMLMVHSCSRGSERVIKESRVAGDKIGLTRVMQTSLELETNKIN